MALEFNARADYEYQGGDTIFSVPFPYINKSHIVVIVNEDEPNPITAFSWLSENQIKIDVEINTGDTISIRRVTPINDKLVKFTDNNILDEETQNLSQDQVFNAVQEVKDSQKDLLEDMNQFINIKEVVNEQLNTMEDLKNRAETVVEFDKETRELVSNIENTYEDLKYQVKNGLNVQANKNLFSLEITDRNLESNELIGLCKQGEVFKSELYPDAYLKILNEYEQGTENIYKSETETTIVRKYGETEPYQYTANVELEEGVTVYSDEELLTELGQVSEITQKTSKKYTGDTQTFYIKEEDNLVIGTKVYNTSSQIEEIGEITDIKQINTTEYTLSKTGKVYFPTSMSFLKGRPVYEDVFLTKQKGIITTLETSKSDKYTYTNEEGEEQIFYVAEGTVLNVGTKIYSDSTLTQEAGSITSKGQIKSNFYYKAKTQGTTFYFYTKKQIPKVEGTEKIYLYSNSSCTNYRVWSSNGAKIYSKGGMMLYPATGLDSLSDVIHRYLQSLTLISSMAGQNYISVNGSSYKSAYYKQGTVDTEVVSLDNGEKEAFSITLIVENTAIKINEEDYQFVVYEGLETAGSFKAGDNYYTLSDYTLISASGLVFPYKEVGNGHKITLAKYKDILISYKENHNEQPFYVLDLDKKEITVPIIDETSDIYFVVGNTTIARAAIQPVNKTYIDEKFATKAYVDNYLPKDLLESLGEIVSTYNISLEEYNNHLKTIEDELSEI